MNQIKSQNIRKRLLIPFVISLLVIISGVQLVLYSFLKYEEQEFATNLNVQLKKSYKNAIERDIEQISGFLTFIRESRELKQAWKNNNRQELLRLAKPIFDQLNDTYHITHFYFHSRDGVNVLRVHSPDKYNDKISRTTLKQAMSSNKTSAGIEFGTLGQFVLRVVQPWYENGKLIGYIELGEEIDHILSRISSVQNYKLVLSVTKNYINTNHLGNTEHFNKLKSNAPFNGNYIIINKTINNLPKQILLFIEEISPELKILKIKNDIYYVSNIFIKDATGKIAGKLTYLYNINDYYKNSLFLLWGVLIVNLSIGLLLFTFYYQYSGRLNQLLKSYYTKLEHLSKESKKRYQTFFNQTTDALLLLEGDKFIDCNQATLDLLGYDSKRELCNLHPSRLSPEFQPDGSLSLIKANEMIEIACQNNSHRFEWYHQRKNGEIFPVEVVLTSIPNKDIPMLHVVWRDITDRKAAEKEIEYRAYYDSLTGLPNRQLILDRLKQVVITSQRNKDYNALLFIDIDRFKSINDSLGHSIGDLLISETASRIKHCIRDVDTAARFGGDEFLVLLKHIGYEIEHATLHAKRIAQDIQNKFNLPLKLKEHELYITTSIGVCIFPLENESIEDIIKHADTAMYSAKKSGRNKIEFYLSDMHNIVLRQLTLEKDLRQAVKARQLKVYYQPQLDSNQLVTGLEALIRWQHEEHGFINPEEFISIAEDTGIILEIGDFVLEQVLIDMHELYNEQLLPMHISINISPFQFRHPDFINKIKQITRKFNLERHFLTLEVTEGIIIDNLTETIEKFNQLRKLGIRMSLDDFGTGYSSLSYLKRLPLDELKIDKSFIFDILKDPHDALLVQTIINIANQFGLDTVAEGVETDAQLKFLKQNHCKIFQGYLYSQPLPFDEIKQFLKHQ